MSMPFHAGATVTGFPFFRLVIQLNQSLTTYLRRNIATTTGPKRAILGELHADPCRNSPHPRVGFRLA